MVQIANKPFTQLLNLNILDELRIDGSLITPGGSSLNIIEIVAAYTIDVTDDVIIINGGADFNVTLPLASTAVKAVTIKNRDASGTKTLIVSGSDVIDSGLTSIIVSFNEAITVAPYSSGWVIL